MKRKKYTDEQFIEAVKSSTSIRMVLIKLKLSVLGNSYRIFKTHIKRLNLNIDHFTGKVHQLGKKANNIKPIEDYLSNKIPIESNRLKHKLINNNLLIRECNSCKLITWMNTPIPLELDHINGNSLDNSLSNLRLLCCNCHALTPTYCRSKNTFNEKKQTFTIVKNNITGEETILSSTIGTCIKCNKKVGKKSTYCRSCKNIDRSRTKAIYPLINELLIMISKSNYTQVAKEIGVSDNALRKYLKRNGIIPPRKKK